MFFFNEYPFGRTAGDTIGSDSPICLSRRIFLLFLLSLLLLLLIVVVVNVAVAVVGMVFDICSDTDASTGLLRRTLFPFLLQLSE